MSPQTYQRQGEKVMSPQTYQMKDELWEFMKENGGKSYLHGLVRRKMNFGEFTKENKKK